MYLVVNTTKGHEKIKNDDIKMNKRIDFWLNFDLIYK